MWRIFPSEELMKVYKCDKMITIKPFEDEKINNILLKDVSVVIIVSSNYKKFEFFE